MIKKRKNSKEWLTAMLQALSVGKGCVIETVTVGSVA